MFRRVALDGELTDEETLGDFAHWSGPERWSQNVSFACRQVTAGGDRRADVSKTPYESSRAARFVMAPKPSNTSAKTTGWTPVGDGGPDRRQLEPADELVTKDRGPDE